ncbi:THUMP domain-containing protein, partial [Turicimonas muris]
MSEKLNKYYAVVPLSLESLFEEELKQLGITEFKSKKAGCFFTTTTLGMMKANLWTRYASRILLQVGERNYRTEDDIYKFTFSIPWENYFTEKQSIKISLSAKNCPLK